MVLGLSLPLLLSLHFLSDWTQASAIVKRDTTISQSVRNPATNAGLGTSSTLTTFSYGVTYWLSGFSTHNWAGNVDNSGAIIISQTDSVVANPGGMTCDWVGSAASSGNLVNRAGASIQLNDIAAASAPTYDWYMTQFMNNGTMQFCGRGDTGGSTYQLYCGQTCTNNGLIVFEQAFGNLGTSAVWRNSALTTTAGGAVINNNGNFLMRNMRVDFVENFFGTGCFTIGTGATMYMQDGTGLYQNPTAGPTFSGASVSFLDSTGILHMDTAVYSGNALFGATIYGFGSGNAIEFFQIISTFSYSGAILTVSFVGGYSVKLNIGTGYTASGFAQGKKTIYNAILYAQPAPSQSRPSVCQLTTPACSASPVYPVAFSTSSSSTAISSSSTKISAISSSATSSVVSSSSTSSAVSSSTTSSAISSSTKSSAISSSATSYTMSSSATSSGLSGSTTNSASSMISSSATISVISSSATSSAIASSSSFTSSKLSISASVSSTTASSVSSSSVTSPVPLISSTSSSAASTSSSLSSLGISTTSSSSSSTLSASTFLSSTSVTASTASATTLVPVNLIVATSTASSAPLLSLVGSTSSVSTSAALSSSLSSLGALSTTTTSASSSSVSSLSASTSLSTTSVTASTAASSTLPNPLNFILITSTADPTTTSTSLMSFSSAPASMTSTVVPSSTSTSSCSDPFWLKSSCDTSCLDSFASDRQLYSNYFNTNGYVQFQLCGTSLLHYNSQAACVGSEAENMETRFQCSGDLDWVNGTAFTETWGLSNSQLTYNGVLTFYGYGVLDLQDNYEPDGLTYAMRGNSDAHTCNFRAVTDIAECSNKQS